MMYCEVDKKNREQETGKIRDGDPPSADGSPGGRRGRITWKQN